jgi:hypothetical protein
VNSKLLSTFWLLSAAFALSLAWLLPNHTPPWVSFHGDAWAATVLAVVGIWVAWNSRVHAGWHVLTLAVALFCLVPWLQYAFGEIPVFGTTWINSIYLLGFLFALQTGEKWELDSVGQCADFVFTATVIAAVVSTGLQIYQLAGLETIGPWTLYVPGQSRFYANMAQPNQLASLLLLGLLACSWGFYRRKLNAAVAILMACFILVGVALTESRTAWLNLALLVAGTVLWRKKLPSRRYLWLVLGLAAYFAACVLLLPLVGAYTDSGPVGEYRSLVDHARMGAWKMLLDASLQQPLFGFGWGQLARANFLVIENYPGQPGLFAQSHNLILDLFLWNGYPLGLLAIALLVWWLGKVVSLARNFGQLHLLAFVLVLGTHAMLEFPLQYAFFLLPFGLVAGALHTSLKFKWVCQCRRWIYIAISIASVVVLAITIRDYFRVETSFYGLRFESKRIVTDIPSTPPDVIALTQFRDYLIFARNVPRSGLDGDELRWMIDTVNTIPSALTMYKLAENLALNGRPDEAKHWLARMCKTMPQPNCQALRVSWETEALANVGIAAVPWPEEFSR